MKAARTAESSMVTIVMLDPRKSVQVPWTGEAQPTWGWLSTVTGKAPLNLRRLAMTTHLISDS